ncbi:aspartyl/asparaginyl beta-hydroxylase domain-containing protein [Sphingopyxis sp.]|uniref:aspartyl/asparaginyl beta-hydroxylase domain-containing protein n=1 Tax=Sphingopyxis sp. TaxID=1908224 RepID=UPI0025FA2CCB|nr:aspartyl/asparaginyl beta-hydroxylase domain-containing protein [Sphingopyxis sp.]
MPIALGNGKHRAFGQHIATRAGVRREPARVAALEAGDPAAATMHFAAAVAADPASGVLQRNLASAWRAPCDAALATDRRDVIAWIRKAERHEALEEKGAALAAWSAAVALGQQLDPLPTPLAPLLAHGQAFVGGAAETMFAAVTDALSPLRSTLPETEVRRGDAFVASALGCRQVYCNECAGVCYPFLPGDEFFDRQHFPWMTAIEAQTNAIRAELLALVDDPGEALRPYVRMEAGTPDTIWAPLDGQLDWGACFPWEYGEPNQPVLDRCPATAAALAAVPGARIPGRAPSAFFSMLKPRTRIPPHTGVTNTRAPVGNHRPLADFPLGEGGRKDI